MFAGLFNICGGKALSYTCNTTSKSAVSALLSPWIVNGKTPAVNPERFDKSKVKFPAALRDAGLKLALTPAGRLIVEKLTVSENPLMVDKFKLN